MITPEYSFIRCRNTAMHVKIQACIHSLWIKNKWKIPAEVGVRETVPTDVRVRSSPSAADSQYLTSSTEWRREGREFKATSRCPITSGCIPDLGVVSKTGVANQPFTPDGSNLSWPPRAKWWTDTLTKNTKDKRKHSIFIYNSPVNWLHPYF